MKLTIRQKNKIVSHLKEILDAYSPRHWLIGAVYPWLHPANKFPDCVCLTWDGSPHWKFRFVNKTLKLVWQMEPQYTTWISPKPFPIKTGKFVSLEGFEKALRDYLTPINRRMGPPVAGKI